MSLKSLRKLKAIVLGTDSTIEKLYAELEASAVPLSDVDCRTCPNPCDQDHESYPDKFDVDMESQMLGSVKPHCRQVLISTGKSDWEREVTEVEGTLAAYLLEAKNRASNSKVVGEGKGQPSSHTAGVLRSSDSTQVSILNGSHKTLSDDSALETVLVFPDYTVVTEVPRSSEGANELWNTALNPNLARRGEYLGESAFKTWVLPYSCVILLCSHKRRDNRCAVAAKKLEYTLTQSLEQIGWEVHTQLDDPALHGGSSLEEFSGTREERKAHVLERLKALPSERRALLLRNSHMGGHKFAGNCIIHTPQGSSVWYGRVTTHEVEAIVQSTIVGGKVLPPLLRGGLNISRPGCKTLHDW